MSGIKALRLQPLDCPGAGLVKIKMIIMNVNVMKDFYVLSIPIFAKSCLGIDISLDMRKQGFRKVKQFCQCAYS
jgi:hypothetical protein